MIISWLAGNSFVTLEVDATMREDISSSTTVTEYHVETGASVADHARPDLDVVTLDFTITDTPIRVPATNRAAVDGAFSPVPITVPTVIQVPRILPGVGIVTSFLPHPQVTNMVTVLNFDGEMKRRQEVYNELKLLQTSSTLFNITTHLRQFSNMVIHRLSAPRGPADGSSITFSLVAKEMRFVDSQLTTVKTTTVKTSKGVKPGKEVAPKDRESVASVTSKTTELGRTIRKAAGLP